MTNAQVGAFVTGRESFEVIQNYMDAAVGVMGQAATGTINPNPSRYAYPNPFADFAEGVQNAVLDRLGGTNLRDVTLATKTLDGHNFFDLPGTTIDGKHYKKMGDLCKGKKAIMVVNVASDCVLTNQNYQELTELYDEYKSKGLEIIAYPSNQFFNQEPGTTKDIKDCQKQFDVKFPVMQKVDVNGDGSDPVFEYLRGNSDLRSNNIPMNFSKFLVNRDGDCVGFYNPQRSPQTIKSDVELCLGIC